ncbi:MAG: ABC transporter ATP-binding protein [Hyphomicrobiales bacterium]
MAEPIIVLDRVEKRFGPVIAVDRVSFDIARGEFFSLLGASGCGKTTLLRMLAGLEQPTDGEITIDGVPMAGVPANRRPTNMVFQSYAIFPHLNVQENVGYGLRRLKLPRDEAARRVQEALDLVKLGSYGERGAHQLSGGQRQRVALARALVCRPKVLLLDEPLGALDKKLREEMQVELRALQRTVGITFVFVTHDQEEALALSDRIAVMARGQVLQIDTAQRLYEVPNCREVAEFIGNMNLIAGRVKRVTRDGVEIDAGIAGTVTAPLQDNGLAAGANVHLAVRPEKVQLTAKRPAKSPNAMRGVVTARTYLGDRSHFLIAVEGLERPLSVSRQNADAEVATAEGIGDSVFVHWPVAAGLLLDR